MSTTDDARLADIREQIVFTDATDACPHCGEKVTLGIRDLMEAEVFKWASEVDRLTMALSMTETARDWAQADLVALTDATDDGLRTRLAVAIHANDRAGILEIVGALSRRLTAVTEERDEIKRWRE